MNITINNTEDCIKEDKISKVLFGAIAPTERDVVSTNTWNVSENSLGLFFITGLKDDSLSRVSIEVIANGNTRIWSSPLKKLPEDTLNIDGEHENIYISAKVIEEESLKDWGNGEYIIAVNNEDIEPLVLKVDGYEMDQQNNIDDEDSHINEDTEVSGYILVDDEDSHINEDTEVSGYILVDDEGEDDNEDEKDPIFNLLHNNINPTDDKNNIAYEDSHINEDTEVSGNEYNKENEKTNSSNHECDKEEKSIESLLAELGFRHKPFTIHCYKAENQEDNSKKEDIIIEKNKNQYLVVVNNLLPRPIHLFDGDTPYFNFDGPINEFIKKIMKIVCRSYSITEQEFNDMRKLLISEREFTEEEAYIELDNLTYIDRKAILEAVEPKEDGMIIDIYNNECNITYRNNNEILKLSCYEIDNSNKLSIYNDLNRIITSAAIENIYLTGEASSNEICNLLGIETLDRIDCLAKLV